MSTWRQVFAVEDDTMNSLETRIGDLVDNIQNNDPDAVTKVLTAFSRIMDETKEQPSDQVNRAEMCISLFLEYLTESASEDSIYVPIIQKLYKQYPQFRDLISNYNISSTGREFDLE